MVTIKERGSKSNFEEPYVPADTRRLETVSMSSLSEASALLNQVTHV